MKSKLLLTAGLLICTNLFSQTEIWQQQNYCVGLTAGNDIYNSYTMADVMMMPDSTYIMYYTVPINGAQKNCIRYATSSDAINWTPVDTCFCGSADTTARNYIIGGADVVTLTSGPYTYRMYTRCTEKTIPPNYHIRSAVSNDGINWTQEGIVIELQQFGGVANLVLAGHGTAFVNGNGTYTFIFGGNFATDPGGQNGASDLKIAHSTDGTNWTSFSTLFTDYHDPIVIKKNGQYEMYAMYLANNMGKSVSADGITWSSMDSVSFVDPSSNPMLQTPNVKIGDVGGVLMPDNEIYLYTNFRNAFNQSPFTDIIRFTLTNPGVGVAENNSLSLETIVFPVPVTETTVIEFEQQKKIFFELTDNLGRIIFSKTYLNANKINIGDIPMLNGIYFYRLITEYGFSSGKIIK